MLEPEVVLELKGVSKHFPLHRSNKVVHACQDISLTLERGRTLGIVGESGSGKTTLARCVLMLTEPTSGEIWIGGVNVASLRKQALRLARTNMQIVFQEPFDSFNPQLSVGSQIADPLRTVQGVGRAERRKRVEEALTLVGLPREFGEVLPAALSGGELQRCAIARAIVRRPKLIVLDEPTSALPPGTEADVLNVLRKLQSELELTYVLISHDLDLVRGWCDAIAVMYLGQIVEIGPSRQVFDTPVHPYTRALMAATLRPDPRQRYELRLQGERLAGEIPSPVDLPSGCYFASRCRFVRERCHEEPQVLRAVTLDRQVRCWRAQEDDFASAVAGASEKPANA